MTVDPMLTSVGFIELVETRLPTRKVDFGRVDAFLTFASYETRSLSLLESRPPSARVGAVCLFRAPNQDNGRSASAHQLVEFLKGSVAEVSLLKLPPSTNSDDILSQIIELLTVWRNEFQRPYVLGLDISCCPKIYISAVLSFALSTGVAAGVRLHYAEADYHTPPRVEVGSQINTNNFTDGIWRPAQVPYLEGEFVAGRIRHAIVSIGEDALSVEKLIRRYDPDRMTLLRPLPGATAMFEENTKVASTRIINSYGGVTLRDAPPFSAAKALKHIYATCREYENSEDLMAFTLGTKPHAVAVALCGVVCPQLQVIFRIPHKYCERPVSGNGWSWLYSIRDTSNPSAARHLDIHHIAL